MENYHRLTDKKYSEADFLLGTIGSNSDHEEVEAELCLTPMSTPPSILEFANIKWAEQGPASCKMFRGRRHRRYTMSHATPPAPPSTPTLLAATSGTSSISPTASNSPSTTSNNDNNRINHFIYVSSTKNLKRNTDVELSELFNVVTITSRLARTAVSSNSNNNDSKSSKPFPERGVRNGSRTICKMNGASKRFKIHRNPKEFLREPDEDSVSAPEYDTEEEDTRYRHRWSNKPSRRFKQTRRERKLARFEHQERMETIVDNFEAAMNFNDA